MDIISKNKFVEWKNEGGGEELICITRGIVDIVSQLGLEVFYEPYNNGVGPSWYSLLYLQGFGQIILIENEIETSKKHEKTDWLTVTRLLAEKDVVLTNILPVLTRLFNLDIQDVHFSRLRDIN